MRIVSLLAITGLLLSGCGGQPAPGETGVDEMASNSSTSAGANIPGDSGWNLQSSGEGVALALLSADGRTMIRLFCPAAQNQLLVNVPSFTPIGSEERLSFGSGGNGVALVADTRGDRQRGGVTGTGPLPDTLKELLIGPPISASYGAQRSGPHLAPPREVTAPFVRTCSGYANAARQAVLKPTASTSPCQIQDGKPLRIAPLRAIGTEPFWGARIEGRCVTYSTPEDQKGTRVWTNVGEGPEGPIWAGALRGKPFRLITHPTGPLGCSDGMSDERYPYKVSLVVDGEERTGCAEPL